MQSVKIPWDFSKFYLVNLLLSRYITALNCWLSCKYNTDWRLINLWVNRKVVFLQFHTQKFKLQLRMLLPICTAGLCNHQWVQKELIDLLICLHKNSYRKKNDKWEANLVECGQADPKFLNFPEMYFCFVSFILNTKTSVMSLK